MNKKQGSENSENIKEIAPRILYCDGSCVVVNKIAGEVVEGNQTAAHRGTGKGMIDLPRLLAAELARPQWPSALPAGDVLALPTAAHRLDVPVSGCVIFARTKTALGNLNESFAKNTVKRHYWAIVEPPNNDDTLRWLENASIKNIELVHWIEFNPRKNKSIAHDESGLRRKKAILRCQQVGRGSDYLFLAIELITGRHHQIRAQLERLGLHIKGDLKYGARRSERNGGIRLHARSVVFPDPEGSRRGTVRNITVQADPPLRDNLWLAFAELRMKE